jgi:hypothetical protein
VDSVHQHPDFGIEYPDSTLAQEEIAAQFRQKSGANFSCCAGAIDGMLIWIQRPSETECERLGVGSGKFFCARKHKFGLNCQAVCDCRGRILDISVVFPGTTSDCLAFEGSSLFQRLERGLLLPHLCFFGDNAYLNSTYMATPFVGVGLDQDADAYNFYHSQLRIRIECAFGMLTERWSILRRPMPRNITVKKTIAMVCCLAKLHNFCINEVDSEKMSPLSAQDVITLENAGVVPLTEHTGTSQGVPTQLLAGGHHFDDMPRYRRRQAQSSTRGRSIDSSLPRQRLLVQVEEACLRRPTPISRRN